MFETNRDFLHFVALIFIALTTVTAIFAWIYDKRSYQSGYLAGQELGQLQGKMWQIEKQDVKAKEVKPL
jgi:hypothetical protein